MDTPATIETPKTRGLRRLLKTCALLRSGAQDPAEAEVYLAEERRVTGIITKLERRHKVNPAPAAAA